MSIAALKEDAGAREFLTFRLAGGEYGVSILAVQEIRGWSAVTTVPHTPEWLLGVIDLRGVVVPVIDLRLKFKLGRAEYNEFTVVIILKVAARVLGVVVDGVSDVVTFSEEQIRPAPSMGIDAESRHVAGFGMCGDGMRILMDVEKLATGADLSSVDKHRDVRKT